jgi:hypothetical protein
MRSCIKRQKIVKRPGNIEVFRCLNKACGLHGQTVDEGNCARCIVPVVAHKRPCKSLTASRPVDVPSPVTTQEMVSMSDEEARQIMADAGMDVKDIDETFEPGPLPKDYPPLVMQLWTYKEALIRWKKAGYPTRSQEEVKRLHAICAPPDKCEWYDEERKRCKGCGCKVTVGSLAVFNKIKMETEHCPKEKW